MIILQRWETTTSPHFPSLIPFWIKVQGIPVHLWTEDTIRRLGEDIGVFEEADITSLAVRMRVHINGRLPLIKESVIEYKGGSEVIAHLCTRNSRSTVRCVNASTMNYGTVWRQKHARGMPLRKKRKRKSGWKFNQLERGTAKTER